MGLSKDFEGQGGDNDIWEAMFDKNKPKTNLLNTDYKIYKAIGQIAQVMHTTAPLRLGRMYYRQISGDGIHFGLPFYTEILKRCGVSSDLTVRQLGGKTY